MVELRRELEGSHVVDSPVSVDKLWENLGHDDRHIRFAARIGLEHLLSEKWAAKIEGESNPQAILEGALAIARCGTNEQRIVATNALIDLNWDELDKPQRLALLRVCGLMMIRSENQVPVAVEAVDNLKEKFPSGDAELDRELSKALIAIGENLPYRRH